MSTLRQAADEFLAGHRIAVAGVSRDTKQPANLIYRRLRDRGYQVFAVNPNADELEGDPCYHTVGEIPESLDGVVVVTTPAAGEEVMRDCAEAHVPRVWLHHGMGPSSVSEGAVAYGREHGVKVIDGGCPCMFSPTADPGHRCMRAMLRVAGKLPHEV